MLPYIILILVIILLLLIMFAYYSYLKIDVTHYDITDKKIDKNIKIIQLSDLHNRNINDRLVKIIEKENPDFVICSGDMINDFKNDSKNFLDLAKSLNNFKVYYTFGNHEHFLNSVNISKYYDKLLKTNMIILNDSKIKLSRNISLYGVDFDIDCYNKNQLKKVSNYLDNTFNEINKDKYNILIAHNPLWASVYAKKGYDLTLSGHIHGGVIKLPIIGGLLSPEFKFFPEYYEGIQKVKKMNLIVSRGIGFCRYLSFRLFNPAEVVVINLVKSK